MYARCCQRDHVHMLLWGTTVLLVSFCLMSDMVSVVDGLLVIVNHSGRDLDADCGAIQGTIHADERTVAGTDLELGPVDENLDTKRLELLTLSSSYDRQQRPRQTCRVEAGHCFLTWEIELDTIGHEYSAGESSVEWEVDQKGLLLVAQSSNSEYNASNKLGDRAREYRMLWQPSNQLMTSAARCMCAPPASPLAQAFYSVLLYFRE